MPVRWGFIGAGTVATHFLGPAVHAAAGAELYAVGARDPGRAAGLRPTGPIYSSYDALLSDEAVDAVYISLPNSMHLRWTLNAVDAGKHVLCEKPLVLSAADVDAIATAARSKQRLVVEALFSCWHPQVQRARELLAAGAIGGVRQVDAGFTFNGVAPGSFRLDPTLGGGALYDVGCYPLSAVMWAFGTDPVAVTASLRAGGTGVDLAADVRVTFPDGAAAVHVAIDEPAGQWLRIVGDDAVLEITDRPFAAWFGADSEIRIGAEVIRVAATDPYRVMVESVSAAIAGDPAYVVPLADSRRVAAVIDAAFNAAPTG